ncbi:MAG: hypothetical protein H7070_16835 [Saprospiraceae bacterium]|nr:hypothetical protein [Pyrinomonadaceae bacterium]
MIGRKIHIRLLLVGAVAALFAASFLTESNAQKRRDDFLHATPQHKKINCNSCHKIPTGNWVAARGYPDVADYPGHSSCISCHRAEFFSGNRPAICAGCHTNPGPRGAARFRFPVATKSQDFETKFPHNVHQDLIASNPRRGRVAVAHFVNASYADGVSRTDFASGDTISPMRRQVYSADDPKVEFNNCSICHQTPDVIPKFATRALPSMQPLTSAAANTVTPVAGFFKNSPNSHASCFSCHFQNAKPLSTDCAGCHSPAAPYKESSTVQRYSLKFNHLDKDHVNKDCTTCHVRITQNADIKFMKDADVPILTCSTSSCHGSDITGEIAKRNASIAEKQAAFQCVFCHTPEIGRFPIPPSHR